MTGPLVTVVTPSYNQGEFIEDTIESVRDQDYDNIEHIVMDGGSDDETLDILREYDGTYEMEWYSEEDEGQADAIQKGFERADGEILAWLNSDDVYLQSSAVSRMVEAFENHPDADVVNAKGMLLSREGDWTTPIRRDPHRISYRHLRYGQRLLQPATFWRDYVPEEVPFDLSLTYAFDWDFFIRTAEQFDILPIDDYIAGARMYGVNKTAAGGTERTHDFLRVTGRHTGRATWQYAVMWLYYLLFRLADVSPDGVDDTIEERTKQLSRIVSHVTGRRIASL